MFRSPLAVRFAAAYLAVLLPTLAIKYVFLNGLWFDGIGAAVQPILHAGGSLPGWIYAVLLFTRDFWEVGVVIAILLVPAHLVARSWGDGLVFGVVVALLAAIGLNLLCFRQLGTLLTLDLVTLSLTWLRGDPWTVLHFVTPRRVTVLVAGLTWAMIPVVVSRRVLRPSALRPPRFVPVLPLVAGGSIVVAVICQGLIADPPPGMVTPLQGYWSRSLSIFVAAEDRPPSAWHGSTVTEIRAAYERLAFPGPSSALAPSPLDLGATPRRARHVLVVILETAPRKYYPLANPADLPVFDRMIRHALVSDRHFATSPYSSWALFSILSGTYPTAGTLPWKHGRFETDGLGTVLARHGYETTYIDSSDISYWAVHRKMIQSLGFGRLFEGRTVSVAPDYENSVRNEEAAFRRALEAILGADARGKKAFVSLATAFGHFPWQVNPTAARRSAPERLLDIARLFDGLFGRLLEGLAARRLQDDTIVVVTGDHGLRSSAEFESLGEVMQYGDLTFNVPLLVYAPALFPSPVRLSAVTSHVDIAPTLLDLVGIRRDGLLHHGESFLERLPRRIVFLLGTGIYTIDGFRWDDRLFLMNHLTGQVTCLAASPGLGEPSPASTVAEGDVPRVLRQAQEIFEATAAYFLERGR